MLVEAFPAAQLKQRGLPHRQYNGNDETEARIRRSLVCALATRIELGDFRSTLEQYADALDSVLCAFAAIAVKTGNGFEYVPIEIDDEGLIAVQRD